MVYVDIKNHPNIQHNTYFAKDRILFSKNDNKLKKQIDRVGAYQQTIYNLCNGREFLNILNNKKIPIDNIYLRMIFLNGHQTNLTLKDIKQTFVAKPHCISKEEFEKILKEYVVEVNFEIL